MKEHFTILYVKMDNESKIETFEVTGVFLSADLTALCATYIHTYTNALKISSNANFHLLKYFQIWLKLNKLNLEFSNEIKKIPQSNLYRWISNQVKFTNIFIIYQTIILLTNNCSSFVDYLHHYFMILDTLKFEILLKFVNIKNIFFIGWMN